MTHFHPLDSDLERPARLNNPFCFDVHELSKLAARQVQQYIADSPELLADAQTGKMFGVLVVETADGQLGFLAAYSGLLASRNDWPYFVPPVFDAQQPDGHFKQAERQITTITLRLRELASAATETGDTDAGTQPSEEVLQLRRQRKQMSEELQLWLFHQYRFLNARGEWKDLVDVWQDYHCSPRIRRKFPLPPGGTGDCCAPKLLQHAYLQKLRPLTMAEFWFGAAHRRDIRHHLHFYPACRGKCKPVLTWMLEGLEIEPDPETLGFPHLGVKIVYEDEALLVVNKPAGMLSVPGRIEKYSVATLMDELRPGSMPVHRLDMWTSGLLLVAKNKVAYFQLQQQFANRTIRKRYIAVLERQLDLPVGARRTISLPLLADMVNRPRQMVDYEQGKPAVTDLEVLEHRNGRTRLALYPHTGRTHQLRMHCAHPDGLNCPILGDELYGRRSERLYLHAEQITFSHPVTNQLMHFELPPDF